MIFLEPFTKADFPQLIAWLDCEPLLKVCFGPKFTYPLTGDQLRQHLRGANVLGCSETFVYKALDADTGTPIGHIALDRIDWDTRTGRISQVLVGQVADRGRGYGQAITQAALAIGFDELGLHRIGLGVYEFNAAAIRCYEQCGFRHIGTLRHVLRYKGGYWSSVEMSLRASEWRQAPGGQAPSAHRWKPLEDAIAASQLSPALLDYEQ